MDPSLLSLTPFDFLLMILGGWAIAYGVVSGTAQGPISNSKEIATAQALAAARKASTVPNQVASSVPKPKFSNSYYGQADGKSGPLSIYAGIRWLLSRPKIKWINEGGYCRVCISASAAAFVGLLLIFNHPLLDLFAFSIAANGAVIVYGNIVRVTTSAPVSGFGGWKINDF